MTLVIYLMNSFETNQLDKISKLYSYGVRKI